MTRVVVAVVLLAGLLAIPGCLFPLNLVEEGPEGKLAVVLDPAGGYDLFFTGGAICLFDEEGVLERQLLNLEDREGAGDLSWSPAGDELVGVILEVEGEFNTPKEWRLVRLPLVGEPQVLLRADYPLVSPRYEQTGSAVLYIAAPEEKSELHRLDLSSGQDELLFSDVLAYLPSPDGLFLISSAGELRGPAGEVLASFHCPEEDCQLFLFLWPRLFLDISPTGEFLALVVADRPGLISPEVDPITSLYLVDLVGGTAERLATPALAPSFSPDGRRLAFTAGTPDGTQLAYIYDLEGETVAPLPGSEGVVWVRWGNAGISVALERAEGGYSLRRWDGTGWRELLAEPSR
ncbi:TPA: hypothetical protein EYH33_01390 [Candidatus Bipolaricaulota bacterium]|nr:hypothetical protein [Candidatus Bipolaricaulota bacterium]